MLALKNNQFKVIAKANVLYAVDSRYGISAWPCNYRNCNFIVFTKLLWPGDSEGTFRSSSQAATCPHVYHTRWKLHTVPLIAECQEGKL